MPCMRFGLGGDIGICHASQTFQLFDKIPDRHLLFNALL